MRHARDYAGVGQVEVLAGLQTSGSAIAQQLGGFSDEQFDQIAGIFGGSELTVAQVIEYVVIGHTAEHRNSIRATIAG